MGFPNRNKCSNKQERKLNQVSLTLLIGNSKVHLRRTVLSQVKEVDFSKGRTTKLQITIIPRQLTTCTMNIQIEAIVVTHTYSSRNLTRKNS
jgi:hypothetical protein